LNVVPLGKLPNQVKPTTEKGLISAGGTTSIVVAVAVRDLSRSFGVMACTVTDGVYPVIA
jgi:hypothetical protein